MNLYDPRLLAKNLGSATPVAVPGQQHVAVLMAVKNGAAWLPEQLASLEAQTHRDWSLIVGDDRSNDQSADVLHRFAARHTDRSIRLWPGPNRGFQANFLGLLSRVPDRAMFVAYSDQDDVWQAEKLDVAVQTLSRLPSGKPALYCGRTHISDAALNTQGTSPCFAKPPGFSNALVQSIAGGNTMVFNRAALDVLVRSYDPGAMPVSHDWWTYQVISGVGGTVVYDPSPRITYRQHGANLVGSNNSLIAKLTRLRRLLNGKFSEFSARNIAALQQALPYFTPENRKRFETFALGRQKPLLARISAAKKAGVFRQTAAGSVALWAAIVLGKI